MLIRFAVENFKSIKARTEIDFRVAKKFSLTRHPDNYVQLPTYAENIIKVMAVFGANASGKSNLLDAIDALASFVRNSARYQGDHVIPGYQPFKLSSIREAPISFEIEFLAADGLRYVYQLVYIARAVGHEALYVYGGSDRRRKNLLFQRNSMGDMEYGPLYKGSKGLAIYDNQLVLSQVAISPNPTLLPAFQFFAYSLLCYTFHDTAMDDNMLVKLQRDLNTEEDQTEFIENINKLLRAADISIERIEVRGDLGQAVRNLYNGRKLVVLQEKRIKTIHKVYDEDDTVVGFAEFDLVDESTGTQKLLLVASIILRAFERGQTLIFDELDKSIHPNLTRMLIGLFNDPAINKNGAQLFIATHDATILDKELFRLDQILIADRQLNGNSTYRKLSEFSGISKVTNLDEWYLLGQFGGVPMINDYELDLDIAKVA